MSGPAPHFSYDQMAAAIEATYGVKTEAARLLGCDRMTVHRYIKKYPDLLELCKRQDDKILDLAEEMLFLKVMGGDMRAIMFTLRCKGKRRGWVEKHIIEHEIKEATPDLSAMAPKDLETGIAGVLQKSRVTLALVGAAANREPAEAK